MKLARGPLICCVGALLFTSRASGQGEIWSLGGECASQIYKCAAGNLGTSVASAGDVNGDGFDDVLVGAPLATASSSPATAVGRAFVLAGQSGQVLFSFFGTAEGDQFGQSVSGVGDVNADGFADVAIGAPGSDLSAPDAGAVQVFSGATGQVLLTLTGNSASDAFAFSLAAAGDVNADGRADFIVGAPLDDPNGASSGSALVVSGADGAALLLMKGGKPYDNFGQSVAGLGDVDQDGYDDVLVGAPYEKFEGVLTGAAHVFSGRTGAGLLAFHGNETGDQFGFAVAGAGDVDADGTPDVLVGARQDDVSGQNAGAAFAYSGIDAALLLELHGVEANDLFGASVSGAGDIDGDGHADLIVGAPYAHCNGANCGAACVVSGASGSLLFSFMGEPGDNFGQAVAGGGDGDGDGLPDAIVGAPFAENSFTEDGGIVFVYSAVPWVSTSLTQGVTSETSVLTGSGNLQGDDPVTLTLTGAAPLAPTVLVLGLTMLNASFKAGTLVPQPDVVSATLPTDAEGRLQIQGVYPAGMPSGLTFVVQFWTVNGQVEGGLSPSNGLIATAP